MRTSHSKPDFIANIRPVDALKDEIEVKGKLQLANHDNGRAALRKADKVATANLPFDMEAEAFQELFDRRVEARFHFDIRAELVSCAHPLSVRLRLQAEIMGDDPDSRLLATWIIEGTNFAETD
jgi:hypothetical protein